MRWRGRYDLYAPPQNDWYDGRMNKTSFVAIVLGVAIGSAFSPARFLRAEDRQASPSTAPANVPSDMVARTFVLLTLTDHPPKLDEKAAAELQTKHLAHIGEMSQSGKVLVAGPFGQRDDETFRGALVFNCSIEEARALANDDPAVKAGRLKVVCMTWNTSKAAMVFPAETR